MKCASGGRPRLLLPLELQSSRGPGGPPPKPKGTARTPPIAQVALAERRIRAVPVVNDSQLRAALEASRSELFNLRRRHIDSFVCDLLLRPVSAVDEYVVVGLYADEDGLAMARSHPAIVAWANEHPSVG